MESLAETPWDVTISGTGLAQSLLALALSRSGKKVLHVDKNPYYGGSEAAFSLREAEDWAASVNKEAGSIPFQDASVYSPQQSPQADTKLSSARAYTLSLSPQLIYSRSQLIPTLVSSKVYRQLEFQAVGSWWIHKPSADGDAKDDSANLYRVPGSREDVFADDVISLKSKRTLMKFLRHIGKAQQDEETTSEESEDLSLPFSDYLASKFQVPAELHHPLLSLSLSQQSPQQTPADYAVPRIKRHLASIGVFGPGFGSLIAKWGGGSEISQVGCRALAVGGGVYVLDSGIQSVTDLPDSNDEDARMQVQLSDDEPIRTKFVVGSHWDLPGQLSTLQPCDNVSRSISVVSSPLEFLFPITAEGAPLPAGAVVVFPGSTLGEADDSPVYLLVHSSETGECPTGQSVIYGSVGVSGPQGQLLLENAVQKLLQSEAASGANVLWSLRYTQLGLRSKSGDVAHTIKTASAHDRVICLPPPILDLAFDDGLIDTVKEAWEVIMGEEAAQHDFMTFEDREGNDDDEA